MHNSTMLEDASDTFGDGRVHRSTRGSSKTREREKPSKLTIELLSRQLKELSSKPPDGIDVWLKDDDEVEDDILQWECSIIGPIGTPYEGGIFIAELVFPVDFPNSPPSMRFKTKIWHPNVYKDGRVCISILHPPGTDEFNSQEKAEERWRPILSVEAVLISVVSMLSDANCNSPANIDAAVMLRKDPKKYKQMCAECVKRSLDDSDDEE